jgi:tRNA threonylcarbamoyladenosine biosynthesis protein TsaB
MPGILALDTSTDACSVAFVQEAKTRESHLNLARAHNQHILAMIDEVLGDASLASDVSTIVVGVGPGSFTGLRVAVGVAQGLAWSQSIAIATCCSLTAQMFAAIDDGLDGVSAVLSVTDAQIGQVYGQWFSANFSANKAELEPLGEPFLCAPENVAPFDDVRNRQIAVIGSGCESLKQAEFEGSVVAWQPDCRPRALSMANQFAHGRQAWFTPVQTPAALQPRYIQQTIGWKKLSEQGRHG